MRVRWPRLAWPRLPNQTRRGRNLPRAHSRQPATQPWDRCRSKAGCRHSEANVQSLNHQGDSGNLVSMAQTKVHPKGRWGTAVPFGFGPACLRLLLNLTVPVGKLAYRMPSSMTRGMRLGTTNSIRSGNPITTWMPAINRWYGVGPAVAWQERWFVPVGGPRLRGPESIGAALPVVAAPPSVEHGAPHGSLSP